MDLGAETGERGGQRRRRRVLLTALGVLLLVFLLLNGTVMALRWGGAPASPLFARVVTFAEGALPARAEVRVVRPAWLRGLANRLAGPPRVGLQVGHLHAADQPDELAGLRFSTGAHAAGLNEVEVNLAVAEALADRLRARGLLVDLLPATVPPGYRADLFLSIHADSSPDPTRSGYKSAHYRPARNAREALLKVAVDRAYLSATGLPDDDRNVSGNMLEYYAFNVRRFHHAVARSTPALIVELGYLSHHRDRALLQRPDELAAALERGVMTYLRDIGRL